MTTEPKLLTEAEWERISAPLGLTSTIDQIASALRERGLIAQEPVDPLLEEAEALHQDWIARKHKDAIAMLIAALRRGREIEREAASPLTRRDLQRAVRDAELRILSGYDIDRLHAALTGPQQ